MREVVLIDKDDTLGEFPYCGNGRIYEGVRDFLEGQRRAGRELYVATNADASGKGHLKEVIDLFNGYFGREFLSTRDSIFYSLPNGMVKNVLDDHFLEDGGIVCNSCDPSFYSEAWKVCQDFHVRFLHKGTGVYLDKSQLYQNPYCGNSSGKDFHLARNFVGRDAKIIMVGDGGDGQDAATDPTMPVVCISDVVRKGNWSTVSSVLDTLFSGATPSESYDELLRREEKNQSYTLVQEDQKGRFCRVVWCT